MRGGVAVVTGASSGIGAATARHLSDAGFTVVGGARRTDQLAEVLEPLGGHPLTLDVTDPASVERFCADATEVGGGEVRLLVNNAGGALGLDAVADADEEQWRWMYDANVLGTMRVTKALLPALVASGNGHVINVGSIAAFETYPGGAGYNAAKHAVRALTAVLREELLGQPVRVGQVDPGMVETDFSKVRFDGDEDRASAVYAGVEPLTAEDVADCITFMATRPSHVNIDQLVVKPRDQAHATRIHRAAPPA
jgi:NADP-dependent 3-hydroxy acid dehydrogenase YdfG